MLLGIPTDFVWKKSIKFVEGKIENHELTNHHIIPRNFAPYVRLIFTVDLSFKKAMNPPSSSASRWSIELAAIIWERCTRKNSLESNLCSSVFMLKLQTMITTIGV